MKNAGAALLLAGVLLGSACDKNPVDVALDEMLDFEGVFEAGDGMQIALSGDEAIITRLGSTKYSIPMEVGDKYLDAMSRTGPREWIGRGRDNDGLWAQTSIRLTETSLLKGGATWERVGSGGSGGGGGGAMPEFKTSADCRNYWNPILKGSWRVKELWQHPGSPEMKFDQIAAGTTKNFAITWHSDGSVHYKYQKYYSTGELMSEYDHRYTPDPFDFWPGGGPTFEGVTSYCRGEAGGYFWPLTYDGTTVRALFSPGSQYELMVLVRQ